MDTTTTAPTTTLNVGTAALADVKRAVAAAGGHVTDAHTTVGACGYTTITVRPAAR